MKSITLSLLVAAAAFMAPTSSFATGCTYIQKQILCVSYPGCSWVHQRCVDNNSSQEDLDVATGSDLSLLDATQSWEYLGCTVDDQQCGMRAARYNYSQHRSETSMFCPNASKKGCYGRN